METERKRLNHQARCSSPVTGGGAILFGSLFTVVSAPLGLMAWGVLPVDMAADVPFWIVKAAAISFLGVGALFLVFGASLVQRRRRAKARLAEHPDEPWLADHPWDPDRVHDDNLPRAIRLALLAGFFVVFLSPFNWWAFASEDAGLFVQSIVGFFDLVTILFAGTMVYRALQVAYFGRAYVRLGQFPLQLGADIVLTFGMKCELRTFDRIRFRLRYVREVIETTGQGNNRSTHTAIYELCGEDRTVEGGDLGIGDQIEVAFTLPAVNYLTKLGDRPPSYWELEVHAERVGLDFAALFPLPVYLRAEPSPDEAAAEARGTPGTGERPEEPTTAATR